MCMSLNNDFNLRRLERYASIAWNSGAVQEAVERGELLIDRLHSYQKLMNENRYVEDTQGYLAEKRQKFKNIAKINKRNRKG